MKVKGIVTKISTTKDQCIRLTIDVDKAFAIGQNLLSWQDDEVLIELEVEESEK